MPSPKGPVTPALLNSDVAVGLALSKEAEAGENCVILDGSFQKQCTLPSSHGHSDRQPQAEAALSAQMAVEEDTVEGSRGRHIGYVVWEVNCCPNARRF